jgi:hypothetical protein
MERLARSLAVVPCTEEPARTCRPELPLILRKEDAPVNALPSASLSESQLERAALALSAIPVVSLSIRLRAEEPAVLPGWLGSTLRGAIGTALRDLCCGRRGPHRCAYARLFEPPRTPGIPSHLSGMTPTALALAPPPPGPERELAAGDTVECEIHLPGSFATDVPMLLLALARAAESGLGRGRRRFALESAEDSQGGPVWHDGALVRLPLPAPPPRATHVDEAVSLVARTPLRLVRDGVLVVEPSLADLAGAAVRRLAAVAAHHHLELPELRVDEVCAGAARASLLAASWRPFRVSRYSSRQHQRYAVDATLGSATWRGAEPWLGALLDAAGRLGIGKGTSFGFGQVRISVGCQISTAPGVDELNGERMR